jgi:hypothetical protein
MILGVVGIEDKYVAAAYILCVASTVLCIIYGVINWNKGNDQPQPSAEDVKWAQEEKKVEEEL